MSYRVFMTVKRGILDKTPVCVYPWERPILEEIHGSGAEEVSIDEMCSTKDVVSVKPVKLMHDTSERPLTLRQQLEANAKVHPSEDPVNDPDGEWARLCMKYGQHLKVNVPNVEKIYGDIGNFRRVLTRYRGPKPVSIDSVLSGGSEQTFDDKPIAEMSVKELRARLDAEGIAYGKTDNIEKLRDLAEMASA